MPITVNATGMNQGRLPILPEDWRKYAPHICEGFDADYLLIDSGPDREQPRYTIIGLQADVLTLHYCSDLLEVHASPADGGLGIEASLFVPLRTDEQHHHGHVAALYCGVRSFAMADIDIMRQVARRFTEFLGAH